MDMKQFAFERPKVSKNNVYNGENIGKNFLSVDLSKANFQALKYVNPDIVLGDLKTSSPSSVTMSL